MKIREAIAQLQRVKPNQYDDGMLVKWISDLDGMVCDEIFRNHEGTDGVTLLPYTVENDMDTELLIGDPYSDVYVKYLSAQVDFHNAEFSRYNNSMMMFTTAYQNYASWFKREHMPIQKNYVRI